MKHKVARWVIGLTIAFTLAMGLAAEPNGSARKAYADDPTATPTPTDAHTGCATIGCGGG